MHTCARMQVMGAVNSACTVCTECCAAGEVSLDWWSFCCKHNKTTRAQRVAASASGLFDGTTCAAVHQSKCINKYVCTAWQLCAEMNDVDSLLSSVLQVRVVRMHAISMHGKDQPCACMCGVLQCVTTCVVCSLCLGLCKTGR
jgi:hypothetical protein